MQHGIIARKPDSIFSYFGWGSVTRIGEHTLIAACSGQRTQHVCPFGKTELFYSFDDGQTWTEPIVVNDTILDDRDAGIVHLGGDRLALTWFNHPLRYFEVPDSDEPLHQLYRAYFSVTEPICKERCGSWLRISEDGGLTWGKPLRMEITAPHGPTLRADGSLLYLGKPLYPEKTAKPGAGVLEEFSSNTKEFPVTAWSSPDGYTWTELGSVPLPSHAEWKSLFEPHVIELPDGRLLGMIRFEGAETDPVHSREATICQTWSEDGGKTWSVPTFIDVAATAPHLLRHSSGAIICAYGRRNEEPFGQRAMISYDDGKTWAKNIELRRGIDWDLGYPCSVELADGSILTVYYQRLPGDTATSFLYTRWTLDEI